MLSCEMVPPLLNWWAWMRSGLIFNEWFLIGNELNFNGPYSICLLRLVVVALVTLLAVEKQNNMLNSKENDKPKKSFKNYKFANRPKVEVQRKTEVLNLFQHEGNNTVLILQYRFFSFKIQYLLFIRILQTSYILCSL